MACCFHLWKVWVCCLRISNFILSSFSKYSFPKHIAFSQGGALIIINLSIFLHFQQFHHFDDFFLPFWVGIPPKNFLAGSSLYPGQPEHFTLGVSQQLPNWSLCFQYCTMLFSTTHTPNNWVSTLQPERSLKNTNWIISLSYMNYYSNFLFLLSKISIPIRSYIYHLTFWHSPSHYISQVKQISLSYSCIQWCVLCPLVFFKCCPLFLEYS